VAREFGKDPTSPATMSRMVAKHPSALDDGAQVELRRYARRATMLLAFSGIALAILVILMPAFDLPLFERIFPPLGGVLIVVCVTGVGSLRHDGQRLLAPPRRRDFDPADDFVMATQRGRTVRNVRISTSPTAALLTWCCEYQVTTLFSWPDWRTVHRGRSERAPATAPKSHSRAATFSPSQAPIRGHPL